MKPFVSMNKLTVAIVALWITAITSLFLPMGCTQTQLDQAMAETQRARAVLVATTQATGDLQKEIEALPPEDPTRKILEGRLQTMLKRAAQIEAGLRAAEAAITAVQTGDITSPDLKKAVEAFPYGGAALALLTIGATAWKAWKAGKIARQLATALDGVTPGDTLSNAKVNGALDEDSKAFAGAVIAKLPDTTTTSTSTTVETTTPAK